MLEIVFWFSQVFGLILMLLKNLSYLFKTFGQSIEMDFFSSLVHRLFFILLFCFVLFLLSINKKRECLEVTVFLILFNLHRFTGLFFGMRKATVVLLHYFCFVQFAMFQKIIKY